jgi:hypothetical protein
VAAQVLSAAVAGVIHDTAHRGTPGTQILKRVLVGMITAYFFSRC